MRKPSSKTPEFEAVVESILREDDAAAKSHLMLEMSQMTRPMDNVPDGGSIYIYSSGDECRKEHNPPHFHFFLSSDKTLSLAVDIVTLTPIGLYSFNKKTNTSVRKTELSGWTQYRHVKKFLDAWLPLKSHGALTSNYQRIGQTWNDQNPNLNSVVVSNLKMAEPARKRKTGVAISIFLAAVLSALPAYPASQSIDIPASAEKVTVGGVEYWRVDDMLFPVREGFGAVEGNGVTLWTGGVAHYQFSGDPISILFQIS